MRSLILPAVLALSLLMATPAGAETLYATSGTDLAQINSDFPGVTSSVPLTGLAASETIVGIDARPATGALYGVGSANHLYTINPATGATAQVGSSGLFTLSGTSFAVDFSPAADVIRVVSDTGQNLRLNPATGALAGTDSNISPGTPTVVGGAYSNNVGCASTTTLYDIDAEAGKLDRQGGVDGSPSPNLGVLTEIGPLSLGTNLDPRLGLDISSATGTAYATIFTGGKDKLYTIDLATGTATLVGQIGTGNVVYSGVTAALSPETVRLASASASGVEGGSATVTVERLGCATGAASADLDTSPGSASTDDYTTQSLHLTWAAGDKASKAVSIPIVDDATEESDETFSVTLSNPGAGVAIGSPQVATVTILANDPPQTVRFTSASVSATEGGMATLGVERVGGSAGQISVDLTTSPGTASAGDYEAQSLHLTWAAGDSAAKTILVPIADDATGEGEEKFSAALSNPTGNSQIGTPSSATVTIPANEDHVVRLTSATATAAEGGTAMLVVERTGGGVGTASVDFATVPGSAAADDYSAQSGTLSWAAGDMSAKTISVPVADDASAEGDETFSLVLTNPIGVLGGSPSSATVTIPANDAGLKLRLSGAKSQKLANVKRRGIAFVATTDGACTLDAAARLSRGTAKKLKLGRRIGRLHRALAKGRHAVRLKLTSKARKRLARSRKVKVTVTATCTGTAGIVGHASRAVTVVRSSS